MNRHNLAGWATPIARRRFLRLAGGAALASAAPLGLLRPLLATASPLRTPGSRPFPERPAGQFYADLAPELAGVDHIIIVMMENHSFDNYFGMLPHRAPALSGRVDGFPELAEDGMPTVTNVDRSGQRFRAFPVPNACQPSTNGPSQAWDASHLAYNGGRMDGFLLGSGEVAMGYWDDSTLPFYYDLAAHFPVCDRYFSSSLCQTYPNRVFAMAGTAAGLISTDTPPPDVAPPNGHVFEVLDSYGINWATYYTDLPTPGLFRTYAATHAQHLIGPAGGNPLGAVAAFTAAMQSGTLPPVCMVETDYQYASEENPQNIQAGQSFVNAVIDALFSVPAVWARSLLVFTYDEHGGYYDHVPPPAALNPGDGTHPHLSPGQSMYGDDYTRLGIRVPTVIVSPWAKREHTSHVVYDHTSILATIQRKWNLPALTYRDANANHLGDCLVSSGPAPFAEPPTLKKAPMTTQVSSVVCERVPGASGSYPGPVTQGSGQRTPPGSSSPQPVGNTVGLDVTGLPSTSATSSAVTVSAAAGATALLVGAARRRRRRTATAAAAQDPCPADRSR